MLLAEPAGGSLERMGNHAPRGMIVHDRTRLTGQLFPNKLPNRILAPDGLIRSGRSTFSLVAVTMGPTRDRCIRIPFRAVDYEI